MPLLRGACNPLTTGRRVAAEGPRFPPPDITNAASISGQSMSSGLARHQAWSGSATRRHQVDGVAAWPVRCLEFMVRLAPRATSSAWRSRVRRPAWTRKS
jgi:hypothetical protein